MDQVIGYYSELFRSNGFTTGGPMGGASRIVSGKNASGTVSVIANVVRGVVEIQVTFAPSAANSGKKHFKAAWYDDARGLLCLEDTSTGEQYYLSGTPLEDFSAQIVAILGDDKVDIRIGKTFVVGGQQPPKDEIGIGIRYSVPKR